MMVQLPPDCRMVLESGKDGVKVPAEAMTAIARSKHHKGDAKTKTSNVLLNPRRNAGRSGRVGTELVLFRFRWQPRRTFIFSSPSRGEAGAP